MRQGLCPTGTDCESVPRGNWRVDDGFYIEVCPGASAGGELGGGAEYAGASRWGGQGVGNTTALA